MGQQQILFLILGVCLLGITASASIIMVQTDHDSFERHVIDTDFRELEVRARAYRSRSFEEGGGDGTFIGLTATPQGIEKLTQNRFTPYAEYSIVKSGNSRSVQIACIGYSPGKNPRKPIHMVMTVYADSTQIAVLN
ncbi:hypothetical protein FBQ87_00105 [Sphingobacteriales bacterium CHB3]|nr:hypothetical protein [Sphingobacteriales bacterium CHB3]